MAKPKPLPSGSYRVQVYSHIETDETGKKRRVYESFTHEDKDEAAFMAAEFRLNKKRINKPLNLTVGEVIDKYIASKDAILSPATVKEYKQSRKNYLQSLMGITLTDLTREKVQNAINEESKKRKPKTIKNMHGLLSAALKEYHPDFVLRTRLPQKQVHELYIPEKAEIVKLIEAVINTDLELPVLLAVMLGLRRSEICALKWEDVDFNNNTITISKAKVLDEHNNWVIKAPKSSAGYRKLDAPAQLIERLKAYRQKSGEIVTMTPREITNKFRYVPERIKITKFSFHGLRHYYASLMLLLGVPDKYAMERMGHASNAMLKGVYQHVMRGEQKKISVKMSTYFEDMQHEMQHE